MNDPRVDLIADALNQAGYPNPPGHSARGWVAPIVLRALAAADAVTSEQVGFWCPEHERLAVVEARYCNARGGPGPCQWEPVYRLRAEESS